MRNTKGEKKNSLAASHPSEKGHRPQERWIGAHWESQETPIAQLPSFLASARITGYRRSGCRAIFDFGRGFYGNTYISVLSMLTLTPPVRLPNA